jgi:sialic acid synthase SpsE
VVKGEILHDPNVCIKSDYNTSYYSRKYDMKVQENYRELIERKVVPLDTYKKILDYIQSLNMDFVVSVYDKTGLDFAVELGAICIKVASSNITHIPLLRYVSKIDVPVLIDTGHSDWLEISRAVNLFINEGKEDVIIQHSPAAPPSPVDQQNIKFMKTLGKSFGLRYGLSDHHSSDEMLYAATALGATVVEKGVCPDGLECEQDRAHALEISKVSNVAQKIANISDGMGSGIRNLSHSRQKYDSRMSIVTKHRIENGTSLHRSDLTYALPLLGIGVEHFDEVIGRKLKKTIMKGEPLQWTDLV